MTAIDYVPGADDRAVARWLEGALADALEGRAEIAVTVPGGSTPFPILALLARAPLDWHRVVVWPGDDRIVAEHHPASNVGRIRSLLGPTGAGIVALSEDAAPPRFALTWLGMGADGHVASLFPNANASAHDQARVVRIVPDPLPPEAPFERLSLTMPALLDTDALVFVIRGDEKRALFEAAVQGQNDLPIARLLAAAAGTVPVTCFT